MFSLHLFILRLLPGLLMGFVCESSLPIFLFAGGNAARGESGGQRDHRTQCQWNQKFFFLKNNIRRKNVSLLLLKCYLPAECLLLLHTLVFHLCLFLPAQLGFFWHSEHAFAYLLNKISVFFFPKSMAMASSRQWFTQPVGKCQSESDSLSCLQMLDPGRTF